MTPHPFDRYRTLIDDWDGFCEALARPLPACVWTNTLRTSPDVVEALLRRDGLRPVSVAWHPGAFRLEPGSGAGSRLGYVTGLYHVQEEVSLLPVVLLDPQPGERVLDLCAAPGNKTARIAVALRNRGTVVANDRSGGRSRAIGGILDRLGVTCACTTTYDAVNYPRASGLFDRVLADVPCSCEGTTRKHPGLPAATSPEERLRLVAVQTAILRKAVRRCRPGGRIVYATCTYAPEENEGVVDAVLRETGDARLLPARVPGFTAAPGIVEWEGRAYHPSLRRALRAWPHHHDTGGFFVAVLERLGSDEGDDDTPPAPLPPADVAAMEAFRAVADRFGFPAETFAPYTPIRASRRFVSLVSTGLRPPLEPAAAGVGLPLLRPDPRAPKLTTAAALAFGAAATRHTIDVDRAQAEAYLSRRSFDVTPTDLTRCAGPGYVILLHDGAPLGVARLRVQPGGGTVESLFPGAWARALG